MRHAIPIRLLLVLAGTGLLAFGLLLELRWLAAAGLAASAVAEIAAQAAARVTASTPSLRLAQAVAETLPAIGIAAVIPEAMLVAVAVIVRPLICGAIETVVVSRGLHFPIAAGVLWRTLAAAANLGLVVAAAAIIGLLALDAAVARHVLWASVGPACAASAGAILRDWLVLRRR